MQVKTMLQIIKMDLEVLSRDISKICSEGHSCKNCLLRYKKESNNYTCILDKLNYIDTLGLVNQKLRELERKEKNV